jgi:hypothetical protein
MMHPAVPISSLKMDLLEKASFEADKPAGKMSGWECFYRIIIVLITSGYGFALILVAGLVACIWLVFGGMSSADKHKTIIELCSQPAVAISGWIFAASVIIVVRYMLTFQARAYERQIKILRETTDKALTIQEKLPFPDKGT